MFSFSFRRFEEIKNYSNEMQSNINNLLKIRAVSDICNVFTYLYRDFLYFLAEGELLGWSCVSRV